jgi:hypothetical protein
MLVAINALFGRYMRQLFHVGSGNITHQWNSWDIKPVATTTFVTAITTTSVTTTIASSITAIPIGKTCKSGYFGKNQKNVPDGSCVGDCIYVPGDSCVKTVV